MFQIDPEEPINAYVFLKDNVNRVEDKKITKDGIHIIIAMQCNHNVQMILREKVMATIEEILDPLEFPLTNTWDDVFDKGISKGGTNWQLYGSRKPANEDYKLVQCYIVEKDPLDGEFMYNPGDINEYYNEDNFYKLSVRNNPLIKKYRNWYIGLCRADMDCLFILLTMPPSCKYELKIWKINHTKPRI